MDEEWFAPEVVPESTLQPPPAPAKAKAPETALDAPVCAPAPAAKTTDKKSVEEKPEEWFAKPSTSTKNSQDDSNEDWFAKPLAKKSEASPKKNLPPEEVNPPPPKTAPPKDLPAELSAKEENPDHWFEKVPENTTDSKATLVKSQPRKEAYMYGYISKVMTIQNRMRGIHPENKMNCFLPQKIGGKSAK